MLDLPTAWISEMSVLQEPTPRFSHTSSILGEAVLRFAKLTSKGTVPPISSSCAVFMLMVLSCSLCHHLVRMSYPHSESIYEQKNVTLLTIEVPFSHSKGISRGSHVETPETGESSRPPRAPPRVWRASGSH